MDKRNIRKITPSAKTQVDASVQGHVGQVSTHRSGAEASKGSESLEKVKKRTPGRTDVLCGRGGGINNHVGNIAFRELVNTEKNDYNLARDKLEKNVIAERVIGWVKERGGRFLSKENGMWIEIDHQRELAKTAQALREGAPRIRAKAAKRTLKKKKKEAPKRRSKYSSSIYKPFSFRRSGLKRGFSSSSATSFRPSNSSSSSSEEHPMIRGYRDGSRGKTLIPVQKKKKMKVEVEVEPEHPIIRGSPNGSRGKVFIHPDHARHPTPPPPEPTYEYRERNTPPPPPQEYEYRGQRTPPLPQGQYHFELSEQTPDYSTSSQIYNAPYQDSKPPHFVSEQDTNVPSYFNSGDVQVDTFSTQSAAPSIRPLACHPAATNSNPQEAAEDILKPDILCSRMNSFALSESENLPLPVINPVDINMSKPTMNLKRIHSLALSEFSGIEFHGDEEFCDPFEDSDENAKATQSSTNTDVIGAGNSNNSANIVEEKSKGTFKVGSICEPLFPGVPPVPDTWNNSSSNSNGNEDVSKLNKVLRYKSSESSSSKLPPFGIFKSSPMTSSRRNNRDAVTSNEHKHGNDNENDNNENSNSSSSNITSMHPKSMKSFYSELSDINDADNCKNEGESQDLHESLKTIYDAATPGLDEDGDEERLEENGASS